MSFWDKVKNVISDVVDFAGKALGVTSALNNNVQERMTGYANSEVLRGTAAANDANRPAWQNMASVANMASYAYGVPQGQYYGNMYGPQVYGPFNPYQGAYNNPYQSVLNRGQFYQNPNQQFAYMDMNAAMARTYTQGTINAPQLALQRMNFGGRC